MNKYKLDLNDVDFEAFRKGNGPGGQRKNKSSTSIRATHKPTGIRVESTKEATQLANKKAAIEILQEKLDHLLEQQISDEKASAYQNKPDSNFASQIRTYRLCGNKQEVLDHRTGVSHPNSRAVLDGDIERFIPYHE